MGEQEGDAAASGGRVHAWERMGEELLVSCPVFDLVARRLRHPKRGSESDFYVLKTRDWVNVLPVTADKKVPLVRQYRYGIEAMSWEIPGGIMDPGEDPVDAGLRELREETGYAAKSCRVLGSVAANPAIMNNRCHFVLADQAWLAGEQEWDEHEEIEVRLFDLDEVYAMAGRGEICHSLVVGALFHYYPEWLRWKARRR